MSAATVNAIIGTVFGVMLLGVLGLLVWAVSNDERNTKACQALRRLRHSLRQ